MNAVAGPFDALAATYDEDFSRTDLGRRLRAAVWRHLDEAFGPGVRVLELGCGTGEDALHLASRGVEVVATDASEAMVAETRRKAGGAGLDALVTARRLSFEGLPDAAPALGPFGGAVSDFGALNCAEDLSRLAETLGGLLTPGAPLLLGVMGRCVPWEWAWYLRRGDPSRAFRRLARGGVAWRGLTVRYPSPGRLLSVFSPWFRRRKLVALG
ncbi:MAG: methyltransferase domain-containing protein, partial [Thermoanaerobaculia bacterium]|nr:methyltransferase domain-containing protein [Thermoanaerobaculia bacterium]